MAATILESLIAPENVRLMLLAYGLEHAYRVVSLEEIAHEMQHVKKEEIRSGLDHLADDGLVTKFSGRYCFNKAIPAEIRHHVERMITSSGTIRIKI